MLSRGPENSQRLAVGIGHQEAGIDVRLGELAGYIQETMESYEVEVPITIVSSGRFKMTAEVRRLGQSAGWVGRGQLSAAVETFT